MNNLTQSTRMQRLLRSLAITAPLWLLMACGGGGSSTSVTSNQVTVAPSQYVKICNDGSREGTFGCPMNPLQGNAINEWACTLDTLTNKMWEVKTNDGGLRDYAKQYTTYDDITKNQKNVGGTVVPPTQLEVDAATNVMGYANALNGTATTTPLCGSTTWRVPTLPELATLVKGTTAPTIDTVYFPNTNAQAYITITPEVGFYNVVSVVNFNTGNTVTEYINRNFLRPVRLVSVVPPPVEKRIAAGGQHTCALKFNGTVVCWGAGSAAQLGNGGNADSNTPVTVSNLSGIRAVVAGSGHTCALNGAGQVACWGVGGYGVLGNGSNALQSTPVMVSNLNDVKDIAAGFHHTCAVKNSGTVVCWGRGDFGVLGNNSTASSNQPVPVSNMSDAVAVSASEYNTCVVQKTGGTSCWGEGYTGKLGSYSATNALTPVSVSGLNDGRAIASGNAHTCALRKNGAVTCWGESADGQLGNGANATAPVVPVTVSNLTDAIMVAAGYQFSCAIKAGGSAACWGYGAYGNLGNGSKYSANVPVPVSNLTNAETIATGNLHACVILSTRGIACWGDGAYGKLGDGLTTGSSTPVTLPGFSL